MYTLEQAGKHLVAEGVVNFENMTVEGKQLLKVCDYAATEQKDITRYIKRQITRYGFVEGKDFNTRIDTAAKSRVKPKIYEFTMNAAIEVYKAATTGSRPIKVREEAALTTIEQLKGITLQRQYHVPKPCGKKRYFIDGYDVTNNIAYEIDEEHHNNQQDEDYERERFIKGCLGCEFVRIKV